MYLNSSKECFLAHVILFLFDFFSPLSRCFLRLLGHIYIYKMLQRSRHFLFLKGFFFYLTVIASKQRRCQNHLNKFILPKRTSVIPISLCVSQRKICYLKRQTQKFTIHHNEHKQNKKQKGGMKDSLLCRSVRLVHLVLYHNSFGVLLLLLLLVFTVVAASVVCCCYNNDNKYNNSSSNNMQQD